MITLKWIDYQNKSFISTTLRNRIIYRATINEIIEEDLDKLLGSLLSPITPETLDVKYWVVYKNIQNVVCIAPLEDDMVKYVMECNDVFKDPIDIRSLLSMFQL